MGSICHNYYKNEWVIKDEKYLRKDHSKIIYNVITGYWDDWYTSGVLGGWINRDVYNKIIDNIYKYKSTPYDDCPIKVYNEYGTEIDIISDAPIINCLTWI